MIDQATKNEIIATVNRGVAAAMERMDEQYLSTKQLCEVFQCFTPSWLKMYGHLLPRVQATVVDRGVEHKTGWAYPRHTIRRMIEENKLIFQLTIK